MNKPLVFLGKTFQGAAALALCCALGVGCGGGSKGAVATGNVKLDGVALANSSLVLHYEDGKKHSIGIDTDGSFKGESVPLGKATVSFLNARSTRGVPTEMGDLFAKMKGGSPDMQKMASFLGVAIPAKYTDEKTSGFAWEITSGTNTKDFELTAN
jgi:hypothetical protein